MGRPIGINKTGGRQKGTPNKKTLEFTDILTSLNINPLQKINELIPQLPVDRQVGVWLELLPYMYPKRKHIEHTQPDGRAHV